MYPICILISMVIGVVNRHSVSGSKDCKIIIVVSHNDYYYMQ